MIATGQFMSRPSPHFRRSWKAVLLRTAGSYAMSELSPLTDISGGQTI